MAYDLNATSPEELLVADVPLEVSGKAVPCPARAAPREGGWVTHALDLQPGEHERHLVSPSKLLKSIENLMV